MFIFLKKYFKLTKIRILSAITLTIIYFLVNLLDIVVASYTFNIVFGMPIFKVIVPILVGIIHFIIYFIGVLIVFKLLPNIVKFIGGNKKIAVLLAIILWLWESRIAELPKMLAVFFPSLAFDHGFVPNTIFFTFLFIANYLILCLSLGLIMDINKDKVKK